MKKLSYLLATLILSVVLCGGSLFAQDQGTYIDNASPEDSSYFGSDVLSYDDYYQEESSNNTAILIGAVVVVAVGAVVIIVLRKKKKK